MFFAVLAAVLCLLPVPTLLTGGLAQAETPSATTATRFPTSATTAADSGTVDNALTFRVALEDGVAEYDEKTFLRAIVTCEMPLSYSEEALKAQAVASYTYYSRKRQEARARGDASDFSDVPGRFVPCTTEAGLKERLGKYYDTYRSKLDKVISAVYGYVIRYKGALILAAYHAISSGTTEAGETVWQADYPYLQAVPSPGDKTAEDYTVQQTFTSKEIQNAFKGVKGMSFTNKPAKWFQSLKRTENGLVTGLTLCGTVLTGTQVRKALGLRSANFTVDYNDKEFTFTVLGYGHGVGLSQYGAHCMAQQGSDWQEILHHYYTDVEIGK